MTLRKAHITQTIYKQTGFTLKKSVETVETLLELIKSSLESGDDVLVSGFGKFCVKEKGERKGRNPATGVDLMLPPRRVVRFRCSGKLRSKINVYPPDNVDRRKHKRSKIRNLVSYISCYDTGQLISHGLGKVLDINKGGILLETPEPIKVGLMSLTPTDVENNLIEIFGNAVYCNESSNGRHQTGIAFLGTHEEVMKFVTALIKEYNFKNRNLFSDQAL